jgi:hypothetical protein
VRWYSTIGSGAPQELPLVGFATLGLARAYDRIGERTEATNAYRKVAALWHDADPPLKAMASAALVAASPGGTSR